MTTGPVCMEEDRGTSLSPGRIIRTAFVDTHRRHHDTNEPLLGRSRLNGCEYRTEPELTPSQKPPFSPGCAHSNVLPSVFPPAILRGCCSTGFTSHGEGIHPHRRGARAQSEEPHAGDSARQAGGHHRPERLRQIVARLRHDLRRGPAQIRRVAFRLRAAVPRPDAEAGRGFHRGSVARDRYRATQFRHQSALDHRHHNGDLRLPAPALRARWPAALSGHRRAHRTRKPPAISWTKSSRCRRERA